MRFEENIKKTRIFLALLFLSASAQAGVINGGGGKGVLCAPANGSRSLESLDRYEARVVWGYRVSPSQNFDAEFRRSFAKLHKAMDSSNPFHEAPNYSDELHAVYLKYFQKFQSNMRFLPEGARLQPTDDAGKIVVPPAHCSVVQVITYVDENDLEGAILVDQEYWNLLTPQDQVAFFLHEWIYKLQRANGEKFSTAVRKMVGRLISEETYPGKFEPLLGRDSRSVLACFSSNQGRFDYAASFYVVPTRDVEGRPNSLLVFDTLGQSSVFAATTAVSDWEFDVWAGKKVLSGGNRATIRSILGFQDIRIELDAANGLRVSFQENEWQPLKMHCYPN